MKKKIILKILCLGGSIQNSAVSTMNLGCCIEGHSVKNRLNIKNKTTTKNINVMSFMKRT